MVAVADMGAQEHRRTDHGPYITAVGRGLDARDVRVAEVRATTSGDGLRGQRSCSGRMRVLSPERIPGEASASWDEDNGWSPLVRREPLASRVHKGLGVVPDPEDVAAWAVALLAHPELTPSREGHPFRDHRVADPEFEARLAVYASAG